MPLQFAWKDTRTDFFEFDADHGYDRSMPYIIVMICLFLRYFFSEIRATVEYYTKFFVADADGFVS